LRAGCVGNRVRSFCSGEQYDQDLGLYYLRARYYNPATGRFLSRDPFDGYLDDPATLHKYLYVGGDPVNWIDPTGLDEFMDIGAIDLEVSTGEDAELAAIEKRIACILQTASDALEVAIAPTGETVGSLVLDFAQCAVKAGYKENPNRQLSFGKYKNGKFKEVGRIDIGRIGAPGEGASTHMHIGGSGTHLPITTAFPW
jgi:RHS repeat-associated protein